eukprot:TRINITY_DN680_c0_g2_i1.p2 TRINITY_DN680_c0_g2~~TRINITY_DN680_c0_g2_i1.p2  ORF type:complete len:176 (+),score=17.20 TRINITY_DN680_c0_g2_i1:325-852(+)
MKAVVVVAAAAAATHLLLCTPLLPRRHHILLHKPMQHRRHQAVLALLQVAPLDQPAALPQQTLHDRMEVPHPARVVARPPAHREVAEAAPLLVPGVGVVLLLGALRDQWVPRPLEEEALARRHDQGVHRPRDPEVPLHPDLEALLPRDPGASHPREVGRPHLRGDEEKEKERERN